LGGGQLGLLAGGCGLRREELLEFVERTLGEGAEIFEKLLEGCLGFRQALAGR
jgi:hypothetical protein